MVSRHYLRIKVFQAIYAHEMNPMEDIAVGEKKLSRAIENCYTLFLYLLSLFPELKRYRLNKMDDAKNKFRPTEADLKPNTNFVDNAVIAQIENNKFLKTAWINHHINWSNDFEFIAQAFNEIVNSAEYKRYLGREICSYSIDKKFVLGIICKNFVHSPLIPWFFEEKDAHWCDDYNEALLMLYKSISNFSVDQGDSYELAPLFKSQEEDVDFYKQLYRNTLAHTQEFYKMIESKLKNWEAERVCETDMILMKMALCELTQFSTIPVKVTINEYIELAKSYSSAKSRHFINGLLDTLMIELKETDQIHKTGLGLIDETIGKS